MNLKRIWVCKDGTRIPVECLGDNHLRNIIAMVKRQPDTVFVGGDWGGGEADDMWGEEKENEFKEEWLSILEEEQEIRKYKRNQLKEAK